MHINPLSNIFLHNQCNDQNVIFLMKKFVVTFVTKNMRHEMVSCIWSWRKKTEKATLFLIPFYVSDKSLNRSWAILSSEKKVEVLNPQLKSWILSNYTATTLFCFCSFWWREKLKLPMTSFTINWTSKMSSLWWRNLWSLLLPKNATLMSCI